MKKADIMLLIVIMVIGTVGILVLFLTKRDAAYVFVSVNGELIGTYDLSVDREVLIETEPAGLNCLQILEGKVQMLSANCPNGDCVQHKEISQSNESIVCLPHKVVITVHSDSKEQSLDAVAY